MDVDLNPILADLAAGRIDADEAGRRIDRARAGLGVEDAAAPPAGPPDPGAPEPDPSTTPEPSWADIGRDMFGAASGLLSSAAQSAAHTIGEQVSARTGHDEGHAPRSAPGQHVPSPEKPAGSHGVERVVVHATGRRIRIIGDRAVATLAVDGPHVLRRNGTVLEVTSDGELGPSLDGFSLLRSPLVRGALGGVRSFDDLRTLGLGKELLLRVNPDIPVDVEATACSLTTTNVWWLGKVRVTAGSASLGEVVQIADALVQAGSASVRGRLDRGRSRVRVESGNLAVQLAADADVEVHADANLGRLSWPGGAGQLQTYQAGAGRARLDIAVVMGAATIRQDGIDEADEHPEPDHDDHDNEENA